MRIVALVIFKVQVVLFLIASILLRLGSEHAFIITKEESLTYLILLLGLVLIVIVPRCAGTINILLRIILAIILLGMILIQVYWYRELLTIDFESLVIGMIIHGFILGFIGIVAYVLYLVITNQLVRNNGDVRNETQIDRNI